MKKILVLCLAAALIQVSGCSYSATHNSEASVEMNSNGKVETNALASIYTERVENGKTVNNSASVAVDSRGGSGNMKQTFSVKSEEGLAYTVKDADLRKGEAELDGYFVNSGSKQIKISTVFLTLEFYDEKGKLIWKDESEIKNLNLAVKPGEKATSNFVITNPDAPAHKGSFDMKYTMEYN